MSIPIAYTVALTCFNTLSTQVIAVCSVRTGLETLKHRLRHNCSCYTNNTHGYCVLTNRCTQETEYSLGRHGRGNKTE